MEDLFNDYLARQPHFDGSDIDMKRDGDRLTGQISDIYSLMKDGKWRTLGQIEEATGHPQASISAQLRHLRKDRFGAHKIDKNYLGDGLYEYRICIEK